MKVQFLFAALLAVFATEGAQADAPTFNDLRGQWKEVGYRCVGDTEFFPRDNTLTTKFFTIGDGVYFHRDELTGISNCSIVQSAGTLTGVPKDDRLEVTVTAITTFNCGDDTNSPLVDDFSPKLNPSPISLRLDTVDKVNYLIVGGDDVYRDPACANPVVERVYKKQ